MPNSRSTFAGRDLLLATDDLAGAGERAKRAHLERRLRAAVSSGRLVPGSRLPSARSLAADLGLSRGVVVDAYEQLAAEGYLVARRGSGTSVAASVPVRDEPDPGPAAGAQPRYDLRPGTPDLAMFPRTLWSAATRQVLRRIPDAALGYGPPNGSMELRTALSAYLARVRGLVVTPAAIIVSTGCAQGVSLTLRVLRQQGHSRVAVEDPGAPELRGIAAAAGLRAVPVPVDAEGIRVDLLASSGARVALVSPAHQFPTGVQLSPARRRALVAWAHRSDGLVVEDDYDSEFRYDRQPVGAVQGLAPDRVLYAGTASKTLAPALRLGWMVVPAHLRGELLERKRNDDVHSPALEQLTLADLVQRGAFDRHLRRVRVAYRRRRDRLLAALSHLAPRVRVRGIAAGLHVVLDLPAGTDEGELVRAGAERSLGLYGLARYTALVQHQGPDLVVGYTRCPEHSFAEGLRLLVELLEGVLTGVQRCP